MLHLGHAGTHMCPRRGQRQQGVGGAQPGLLQLVQKGCHVLGAAGLLGRGGHQPDPQVALAVGLGQCRLQQQWVSRANVFDQQKDRAVLQQIVQQRLGPEQVGGTVLPGQGHRRSQR